MTPAQLKRAEQLAKSTGSLVISEVDDPTKLKLPEPCTLREEDAKEIYPELFSGPRRSTDATLASIAEAKVPKWDQCRGNHTESLPDPGVVYPGMVSFRAHLDKPLSDSLWVDLIFRMKVRKLRIQLEGAVWKSDDWPDCVIVVDENDVVRELHAAPHTPTVKVGRAMSKSTDLADRCWISEEAIRRADFS